MKRRAFISAAAATPLVALPAIAEGTSTIESLRDAFDEVKRIAREMTPEGYDLQGVYMLGDGPMLAAYRPDDNKDRLKLFVDQDQGWITLER